MTLTEEQIRQVTQQLDEMATETRFVLTELFGGDWDAFCNGENPKVVGTKFHNSLDEGAIKNVRYLGIRRSGRANEYQKYNPLPVAPQ
jgi:Domain of unknown function (DUF1413)